MIRERPAKKPGINAIIGVTIPHDPGYYYLVSANFFELPESEQISELTIFASNVLEAYEFSIKSIESINY